MMDVASLGLVALKQLRILDGIEIPVDEISHH